MKIIVVYDNNVQKSDAIFDIIGDKLYADVVIRKKILEDYTKEAISKTYKDVIWKRINSFLQYQDLSEYIKRYGESEIKILHIFSNFFIADENKVSLSLKKIFYVDEIYKIISDKKLAGLMFENAASYMQFLKSIVYNSPINEISNEIKKSFNIEGLIDISNISNFVKCITGSFDSRFYNSLKEDDYTVTKSSTDKIKIKKEYSFYGLLPEDMKFWFVMPFNYKETHCSASYTMERFHMTDLAIKWVHGSIDEKEFENLLNKYMFFFSKRHNKKCSKQDYINKANELYVKKVIERINDFKKKSQYSKIERILSSSGVDFENIVNKYFSLKKRIENKNVYPLISVIGHGDPGFANALYNKTTQTLKFIDPKGALCEEELWTNPYYDIAKLSHCICGKYDFFNNNLFEIKLNDNMTYELEIPFDNSKYKKMFKDKLNENNFDYLTIRIYEASLFLSMLPLHIDNPFKVLGFILNVKNILEELEKDV